MKYKVDEVKVIVTEDERIVAGSVNVYEAEFSLDSSWDEFPTILAVFQRGDIVLEQPIIDNKCVIPWEVLEAPGYLFVGVRGISSNKKRPTLWAPQKFINAGAEPGAPPREPTPDIYQQLLDELKRIGEDELPQAVDAALAQAKESGEFDGKDGDDGVTPHIGENGNWYIGDTDTGVRAEGEPGTPGKDGADGKDGKTPVKGVDYFTESDKAEMVEAVLAALPDGDEVYY